MATHERSNSRGGVVEEVPAPSELYTTTSLADQAITHDHHNRKKKRQSSPLGAASPWSTGREEPDDSSSNDTAGTLHLYDEEVTEADLRGSPSKMEIFSEISEGRVTKCLRKWKAKRILYFLPDSPSVFEVPWCRTDSTQDGKSAPGPSNQVLKQIRKLFAALRNRSLLVDDSPNSVDSAQSEEAAGSMKSTSSSVLTIVVPARGEWDLPTKDILMKKWRDAISHYCRMCDSSPQSELLSPGKLSSEPHISVACGTLLQHPFFYEASIGTYTNDLRDNQKLQQVDKNEGFDLVIADIGSCFEFLDPCSGLSLLFDSLRQTVRVGGTLWLSGAIDYDLVNHDISKGQLQRQCFEWMLEGGMLTEKLKFQYIGSTLYAVLVATNPISVMIREAHALKHIKPNIDFVGFGCNKGKTDRFVEPFRKVLRRCGIQSVDLLRDKDATDKLSGRSVVLVKPEDDALLHSLKMDTASFEGIPFFDSLEISHAMTTRTVMLACMRSALPSFADAKFSCPNSTIISGPFALSETASEWLGRTGVALPAVVKPIPSNEHEPFHVINEPSELTVHFLQATGRTLPSPAIVQSLVEHKKTEQSGHHKRVVWKVSVIRNRFCVSLRASISPESNIYHNNKLSRVSKFPPTHTPLNPLDRETLNIFGRFTAALRKRLNLRLFNVDVIETTSESSQRCFSVVDLNYWPGFSETPNKLALLVDALCQRELYPNSEAPLVPVCTPPTRAMWACFRRPSSSPEGKESPAEVIKLSHIRKDADLDDQTKSLGSKLPPLLEGREQDSSSPEDSGIRSAASVSTGEHHPSPISEDTAGVDMQAVQPKPTQGLSYQHWISKVTLVTVLGLGGYAVYKWVKSKK